MDKCTISRRVVAVVVVFSVFDIKIQGHRIKHPGESDDGNVLF